MICLPITHRWKCWMVLRYLSLVYFYQHIFPFCCLYLCTDVYRRTRAHLRARHRAPGSPGTVAQGTRSWRHRCRRGAPVGWPGEGCPHQMGAEGCHIEQDTPFPGLQVLCCPRERSCFPVWGISVRCCRSGRTQLCPVQAEGDGEDKESIPLICSPLSTVMCAVFKGSLPVHLFGVC